MGGCFVFICILAIFGIIFEDLSLVVPCSNSFPSRKMWLLVFLDPAVILCPGILPSRTNQKAPFLDLACPAIFWGKIACCI